MIIQLHRWPWFWKNGLYFTDWLESYKCSWWRYFTNTWCWREEVVGYFRRDCVIERGFGEVMILESRLCACRAPVLIIWVVDSEGAGNALVFRVFVAFVIVVIFRFPYSSLSLAFLTAFFFGEMTRKWEEKRKNKIKKEDKTQNQSSWSAWYGLSGESTCK